MHVVTSFPLFNVMPQSKIKSFQPIFYLFGGGGRKWCELKINNGRQSQPKRLSDIYYVFPSFFIMQGRRKWNCELGGNWPLTTYSIRVYQRGSVIKLFQNFSTELGTQPISDTTTSPGCPMSSAFTAYIIISNDIKSL